MAKLDTEEKVLKKFGVNNVNELTAEHILAMKNLYKKIDPAVAKKILEQIPNFSDTVQEVISEYKLLTKQAFETNETSMKQFYETSNLIINACQQLLEKDNLSFDEKQQVINYMMEIHRMMYEKDSENKIFIGKIVSGLTAVAVAVGGTLVSIIANRDSEK